MKQERRMALLYMVIVWLVLFVDLRTAEHVVPMTFAISVVCVWTGLRFGATLYDLLHMEK